MSHVELQRGQVKVRILPVPVGLSAPGLPPQVPLRLLRVVATVAALVPAPVSAGTRLAVAPRTVPVVHLEHLPLPTLPPHLELAEPVFRGRGAPAAGLGSPTPAAGPPTPTRAGFSGPLGGRAEPEEAGAAEEVLELPPELGDLVEPLLLEAVPLAPPPGRLLPRGLDPDPLVVRIHHGESISWRAEKKQGTRAHEHTGREKEKARGVGVLGSSSPMKS